MIRIIIEIWRKLQLGLSMGLQMGLQKRGKTRA